MTDEKMLQTLNEKGFKNYTYTPGDKKIKNGNLIPNKCKNITGIEKKEDSKIYYAQTNKGEEMATKLILRTMRNDKKKINEESKLLKQGIDNLKIKKEK